MNDKYDEILYKLSQKAYKKSEIPVAAIIVRNGKIIAKGYNRRRENSNPLNHAEVLAIIKAARKIKDWRLDDCDLYVTLKPCHMCMEIIRESRIRNVYYYIDNSKTINYKTAFLLLESKYSNKFSDLLTNFFKKLR